MKRILTASLFGLALAASVHAEWLPTGKVSISSNAIIPPGRPARVYTYQAQFLKEEADVVRGQARARRWVPFAGAPVLFDFRPNNGQEVWAAVTRGDGWAATRWEVPRRHSSRYVTLYIRYNGGTINGVRYKSEARKVQIPISPH